MKSSECPHPRTVAGDHGGPPGTRKCLECGAFQKPDGTWFWAKPRSQGWSTLLYGMPYVYQPRILDWWEATQLNEWIKFKLRYGQKEECEQS